MPSGAHLPVAVTGPPWRSLGHSVNWCLPVASTYFVMHFECIM